MPVTVVPAAGSAPRPMHGEDVVPSGSAASGSGTGEYAEALRLHAHGEAALYGSGSALQPAAAVLLWKQAALSGDSSPPRPCNRQLQQTGCTRRQHANADCSGACIYILVAVGCSPGCPAVALFLSFLRTYAVS